MFRYSKFCTLTFFLTLLSSPFNAEAQEAKQPVKVYILSGQSNMVGIGQVTGGGMRWGTEFIKPILSQYTGDYDPNKNYDELKPILTQPLDQFGGVEPTPYPQGGTRIVRGTLKVNEAGVYELRPGYGGSTNNIMEVNGQEVYRKEPDSNANYSPINLTPDQPVPFKITYLTSQADGLGWIARVDIPGTLATLVKQQGKFPYLIDAQGHWAPRDDVWYKGVVTATADQWLNIGCGAGNNKIGPELGFGHVIGNHHEAPVLIIKASQGNRSLAWDFLPPGSKSFENEDFIYAGYQDSPDRWKKGTAPEPINWYAGKQYDDCFQAVHDTLDNFDQNFPQFAGRGFEIAGFVWWQGHKDQGNSVHTNRYEQNLVHLIKTLRKEFQAPAAPFVVATIGFDGHAMTGNALAVANAQLNVSGERGNYPEFKGNVKTVETRDYWRDASVSPREQGFHYNQNAETYMLVGEAMGRGMIELLNK